MADGTCAGAGGAGSLFTDGGNTTYLTSSDVLGIGTTTAGSKLTVYGDIFAEGSNRYLNFGTATGTSGYGFRDNAGTLEFKNSGGTWQGVTTATSGPSFYAHKNGSNQTVTANVTTLLTWSAERFDTNNNFDLPTERFTPAVPGKYIVTLSAQCADSTSNCQVHLHKNGSQINSNAAIAGNFANPMLTLVVEMNGSTDYLEGYVTNVSGTTIQGDATAGTTYFTGALIAPVNATAGGWQNDGTQSFLADSTDNVGIGTTTPWAQLSINPNGISGPSFVIGSSTATNFIVTNSGNVGIGTTSPAMKLHVSGATHDDALGFIQVENVSAFTSNASLTAKNFHGTSQFMQWESQGLRRHRHDGHGCERE